MVNQMKRLTVFAHKSDADAILERLMWQRCVEVSERAPAPEGDGAPAYYAERCSCDRERTEYEQLDADITAALDALRRLVRKREKPARGAPPPTREEFLSTERAARAKNAVREAQAALERRSKLSADDGRAAAAITALSPWRALDLPISRVRTRTAQILLGSLPNTCVIDDVLAELQEKAEAYAEQVSSDAGGYYVMVLYRLSDEENAMRILSQNGFLRAVLPGGDGTPEQEIARLEREREMTAGELCEADARLAALLPAVPDIEILSDIVRTRLCVLRAKARLHESRNTVLLEGWAPEVTRESLSGELDGFDCAYEFTDPGEDEDVPVLLDNPALARPFETVLGLYSLPKYRTFDPTVIMGIFYFIIFGMMFADLGYGLLLTFGCLALLRIMRPKAGGSLESLLRLFVICGVSSAVCGVLFGGYLGDLPTAFMQNVLGIADPPNLAAWFNPLDNPMLFLVASLAIGGVHMLFGMGIRFMVLIKAGKPFEAVFDVGSWFVLFAGLGLFFLIGLPGGIVALVGVLMLVLTQGREAKNPVMKFLKGLLSLYDLVGYAADVLSYSRILALGLASSVIASVINMLATMGGASGLVFGVIILIGGHALNLAINLLGTFVHTSRLQYIEFFGKFYEDGGRPFEPVLPVTDYIGK